MMHAYDNDYLYHAQKNFAHMIDFAVKSCNYNIEEFFNMFFASEVCSQFENGNPSYIVGKTGCELARLVIEEAENKIMKIEDIMYLDKSPEYWLGWALSYYIWFKNYKFSYVLSAISAGDMIGWNVQCYARSGYNKIHFCIRYTDKRILQNYSSDKNKNYSGIITV